MISVNICTGVLCITNALKYHGIFMYKLSGINRRLRSFLNIVRLHTFVSQAHIRRGIPVATSPFKPKRSMNTDQNPGTLDLMITYTRYIFRKLVDSRQLKSLESET